MSSTERNLEKLFSGITAYYSPKIIGEVNDVYIKITKVKGHDVPWHTHDFEDEMFYIIKGAMTMEIKGENSFVLKAGEFYIVNRGQEHRVYADDECWMMLVENKSTQHTGKVKSIITKTVEEQM